VARRGHKTAKEYFGEDANSNDIKKLSKIIADDLTSHSGMKVTPKEADGMWDAVVSYSGSNYKQIREAYTDPSKASSQSKKQLAQVESFIDKSPKWSGRELYRGINVGDDVLSSFKKGGTIDMKGPSSWSAKKDIGEGFASKGSDNRVLFKLPETKKGASITHLSNFGEAESEVLASGTAKYRVKEVSRSKIKGQVGKTAYYTVIDLEEVDD
jgi:hypothetical protein